MARELEEYQIIERSVIKKYRKDLWNPFIQGVKQYRMINDDDCIGVPLDNTAASMLLAKLLSHLKRISDTKFELVFFCRESDTAAIENAKRLHIPVQTVKTEMPDAAVVFGCRKIAGAACLSDVVETALSSLINEGTFYGRLPLQKQENGLITILPLYCIHREYIEKWQAYNGLDFDKRAENETQSILCEMKKINPMIEHHIFKSLHAVCLDTLPGYTLKGKEYSFLDTYDE